MPVARGVLPSRRLLDSGVFPGVFLGVFFGVLPGVLCGNLLGVLLTQCGVSAESLNCLWSAGLRNPTSGEAELDTMSEWI